MVIMGGLEGLLDSECVCVHASEARLCCLLYPICIYPICACVFARHILTSHMWLRFLSTRHDPAWNELPLVVYSHTVQWLVDRATYLH